MDMDPNRQDQPAGPPDPRQNRAIIVLIVLATALFLAMAFTVADQIYPGEEKLSYDAFVRQVEQGEVKSVTLDESTRVIKGEFLASGRPESAPRKFVTSAFPETVARNLEPVLLKHHVKIKYTPPNRLSEFLFYILPMVVIGVIFYMLIMRQMKGAGGGILSFGKSRAVRVTQDKQKRTFDDVAGIDEAREEVKEIIEFLKTPEKFSRLGGRLPRGVLLIGSPGTGKTLLAKAIAGEADVPFFSISGSDFVEMFVGVGASRVRDLFEQAKANSPCIIFLDEIDAVGRKRANEIPGSGMELSQTLNAILVEMDGFTSNDKVIVIAATNRPDVLDPALLRPGRFDRQITVDLPDIKGREAILKVHVKEVKLAEEVDLTVLARGTPTFSGAELANLVNEAALLAVIRDKDAVDMACMEEARDKVRFGKEKRSREMTEEDRRATAYHEAGHALLAHFLPHVSPLHKVTIIPRGRALGATMQLPEKDEYSLGKKRILGEITVLLSGWTAEKLFMDDTTTGVQNDLERATHMARAMVCECGMSDRLGLVTYADHKGGGFFEGREFSEDTAKIIDEEVRGLIDQCAGEANRILEKQRDAVELLVEALMEFETLSREEVGLLLEEKSLAPVRDMRGRNGNGKTADADKTDESDEAGEKESPPPDAADQMRAGDDQSAGPDGESDA